MIPIHAAFPSIPLTGIAPYLPLLLGALAVVLLEAFVPRARRVAGPFAVLCAGAASSLLFATGWDAADSTGLLAGDFLYRSFAHIAYAASTLAMLLAISTLRRNGLDRAEYYALVLISTAGMGMLAHTRNLVFLFVGLETLTVPLYVLAGWFRGHDRGIEAAAKYFLIGIFSTAFFVMGIAFYYGATGSMTLDAPTASRAFYGGAPLAMLLAAFGFLMVGVGFKIASVPFQFWAPDVYEGAPTAVTALLATGSKVAGVALLVRTVLALAPALGGRASLVLAVLATASLVVANLTALLQDNVKRMLAYSGIAHGAFLVLALLAELSPGGGGLGLQALLFYLAAYTITGLGAWAVVSHVEGLNGRGQRLADYAGLGARHPRAAAGLALCLLSLGGMPPTAGFVAKLGVFYAMASARMWGLAVLALLASVAAFGYYLRVIVYMYFKPAPEPEPGKAVPPGPLPVGTGIVLLLSAAGVLLLGVFPGLALDWLQALQVP